MKENTGQVLVQAPPAVGQLPAQREAPQPGEIEQRHDVAVIVVADEAADAPAEIQRIRAADVAEDAHTKPSWRLTPVVISTAAAARSTRCRAGRPAVSGVR